MSNTVAVVRRMAADTLARHIEAEARRLFFAELDAAHWMSGLDEETQTAEAHRMWRDLPQPSLQALMDEIVAKMLAGR